MGGSKSGSAKKKLGFEGLFDTTDPQVDDMDDVVGMLSGQFATQNPTQAKCQTDDLSQEPDDDFFGRGSCRYGH